MHDNMDILLNSGGKTACFN